MNLKLDAKDNLILLELDRNARESNSSIAKKTRLSKEVVKYRIDRLRKNEIIRRFHTVINYFKLGIIKFKLYLRLTNINKETLEEIGEFFRSHHKTEWVASTTGRWDMIVGYLVNNVNEFDDEVQTVLQKFSKYIQEKAITTTLYLAHQEREFLEPDKEKQIKTVYHSSKDKREKISKTEEKVLRIIANNARMPLVNIAKMIGKSTGLVRYILKKLEEKKIILAYKVLLNPKAMDRIFCKALIYLTNITKEDLKRFIAYAGSLEGAIWPQRVIGNWDFELDFELKNYDEFQEVILQLKEEFPSVIKNYEFCIVSKEFKLDLFPNSYPQNGEPLPS